MATSHDKMRLEAATKAYKAGEYEKALSHLQKMHDQSKVKGRIQQVRAKLKEQEVPPPEDDFMAAIGGNPADEPESKPVKKGKPSKRRFWIRLLAGIVGVVALLFLGMIAVTLWWVENEEWKISLYLYCEHTIAANDDCDSWQDTVVAREDLHRDLQRCMNYHPYDQVGLRNTCMASTGVTTIGSNPFIPVVPRNRQNDAYFSAITRMATWCENYRREDYCDAWSELMMSLHLDSVMNCIATYPDYSQLIGYEQCIQGFVTLDVQ